MTAFARNAIAAAIALCAPQVALAGMSTTDFQVARMKIEGDYKTDRAGCVPLAANAKDICMAEARGKESVALAELAAVYKPTEKARYDARLARADAVYWLAKERCNDRAGNPRDVCVKEAQAVRIAVKADAKAQMQTVDAGKADGTAVDARRGPSADKLDAEFALEKQKCGTFVGSVKEACLNDVKARYRKS